MNHEINEAIVEAFHAHLISSTTMMANMPGFDEAVVLARKYELMGRIGVHLNLTEGKPLTPTITRFKRFCDVHGFFKKRSTTFRLSAKEDAAIEEELDAQVSKCLKSGIPVTHLDSHHHVHTEWAIGKVVMRVAKQNGISAVRLSRNCGPGITLPLRAYKWAYNTRLALNGLAKTQYFAYLSDAPWIVGRTDSAIEIMVHTRRGLNGSMIELDGEAIEHGLRRLNIGNRLTSYSYP
jgi:hypothetical protein